MCMFITLVWRNNAFLNLRKCSTNCLRTLRKYPTTFPAHKSGPSNAFSTHATVFLASKQRKKSSNLAIHSAR